MADFWIQDGNWLKYGVKREYFLERGYGYDNIIDFFLDHQPDLSIVYSDLIPKLDAAESKIVDFIRNTYPEIYNYKGNTMELQKEVDRLRQELAEQKAEVEQLTRRFETLQGNVEQTSVDEQVHNIKFYADDGGAWVGTGEFQATTLPFIRTPYNANAEWVTRNGTDESSEPKPSPEPTEVVYVLRIQPDSILHAKMIEFADEWSYADELIGIEKHYVFE